VACAAAAAVETGVPDESCPPDMRANGVCIFSADFCACGPVVTCAVVGTDLCASAPVVSCAAAAGVETGAPDEACPPGMRVNIVCMFSADFCACVPVVTCAPAASVFCACAPVVACAAAAGAETGAPDEGCPPGMRENAVYMLSTT